MIVNSFDLTRSEAPKFPFTNIFSYTLDLLSRGRKHSSHRLLHLLQVGSEPSHLTLLSAQLLHALVFREQVLGGVGCEWLVSTCLISENSPKYKPFE